MPALLFAALVGGACSKSSEALPDGGAADGGPGDAGGGDPELGEAAGELTLVGGVPRRAGGAPALLTDVVYGEEFSAKGDL